MKSNIRSRRNFLKVTGFSLTAASLFVRQGCNNYVGLKPNFILIQMDDLGWDDLHVHGNKIIETPNIDQLAGESVQFNQFYVNPVCAPSRASLLTGRDFLRTGVSHVNGGKDFLHLDETTLAEVLKQAGYVTGMWGKWHSGYTDGYFPWERGFDEAYMARLYRHRNSEGKLNGQPVKHNRWADEVIVDYAIEFIKKNKRRPFFAYLPSMTCHTPLDAPNEYVQKYIEKGLSKNLATLYGMIDFFDFHLNRLLAFLQEQNLADNTVVLFMSDNGPAISNNLLTDRDREIRYISRFKGHKGNIWENGVKSPLFVRWPGHYKPAVLNTLADITDIFPTLLDLAGIDLTKINIPLDGRSIVPALEGQGRNLQKGKLSFNYANPGWPPTDKPWTPEGVKDEYRPITPEGKKELRTDEQIISVRDDRYKLLLNPGKTKGSVALFSGYALFDILNDPREEHNLIREKPAVAERLKRELNKWFEGIKNEEHSFQMPLFKIGYNGRVRNTIWARGACRISGNLKNTVQYLGGWKEKGDFAEYKIDVVTPGKYRLILHHDSALASGAAVTASVGEQKVNGMIRDNQKVELGTLSPKRGKAKLRIEISDSAGMASELAMEKLISIQLIKQEK